jgi:hypothetical protein
MVAETQEALLALFFLLGAWWLSRLTSPREKFVRFESRKGHGWFEHVTNFKPWRNLRFVTCRQ